VEYEMENELMYSCPEERIVAEKLDMVHNRMNVCNLAYDTRTAMLHADLDEYIDELEYDLLLKGELKSCEAASEYIIQQLEEIKHQEKLALIDIARDYRYYEGYVKEFMESYHQNYIELEEKKNLLIMLTYCSDEIREDIVQQVKEEIRYDEMSPEQIEYEISFDKKEAMDILYEEGLQAVLYYKIEIGKDRLNL
jgi:hypothetical protein